MFSKCPCKHDVQYSKTHERVNDSRYIPIWKTSSLQTFTHACMVKNYVDITGNLSNMSMICLQCYNVNNIYIYVRIYVISVHAYLQVLHIYITRTVCTFHVHMHLIKWEKCMRMLCAIKHGCYETKRELSMICQFQ